MKPSMRPSIADAIPPFARFTGQRGANKSIVNVPLALAVSATFNRYDAENPDLSVDDIIRMTASTHSIKRSEVVELLWGMTNKSAIVAATSPSQEM